MKFSKENSTEAKKNLIILSIIFGVSSLVMFIPQIRELIIKFGEILIGRSLTHEVWHSRFIKWEMEFLLLILFVILISFFEKKIESIDPKTLLVVKRYNSIQDAADDMKVDRAAISSAVNGYHKSAAGYFWKY